MLSLVALLASPPAGALDPHKAITQYSHQVWQAREGLPQNSIHAMLQTRDGYLWLGTQEGLVRFDGVQFTVFDRSNSAWMRSNYVQALLEDRDGGLWVGTNGGGVLRYRDGAAFHAAASDGLAGNQVNCIYQDSGGTLWVGTSTGLSRLARHRFTGDGLPPELAHEDVRAIAEDRHGSLWVGTLAGNLYRSSEGRWAQEKPLGARGTNPIRALARDREGNLWIGTEGAGLVRYRDGVVTRYPVSAGGAGSKVLSILQDREGSLWIGTDGTGLYRFAGGEWTSYSTLQGLTNAFVASLCEDREGSLWIGTHGGGLNRFADGNFTRFGTAEGLTYDDISTFLETRDGVLWIGTWGGGIDRLENGRLKTFAARQGLTYDEVSSLAETPDGTLWAGTWGGGLNRLTANGRFESDGPPSLRREKITCLATDRAGTLWVGTLGAGLAKRGPDGSWSAVSSAQGLPSDNVRAIVEAPDRSMWIGTDAGLAHFADGGPPRRYGAADGLASDAIYSLRFDRAGTLWISTLGGGLTRFADGRLVTFTTADGLFDSVIFQILDDESGYLWMSSNRGVYRVAKAELDAVARKARKTLTWRLFGTSDGMESSECNGGNQPAGIRTRDGRLWFPTLRGAVVVDPENLSTNAVPPPVQIEEVIADKRQLPFGEARLPPGSGALEFHYAGLSFLSPQKVRFRYQLENFDREWIEAGTRRAAYYTNVPPGRYRFRVVACNNDGVWNENGASFAFSIAPHAYQTVWFYAAVGTALVSVAFALYRLRVRGLTRRKAELVRLVGERTRQLEEANQRLEHANRQLRRLSSQDGLTGIANRRQFDEVLDLEWRRAHRGEMPMSLLMIDIDHFKTFNDAHGHQRGDDYLKAIAAALRDGLNRPGDLVARYGGEEFAVILPVTDEEGAVSCAERLRAAVLALALPHERPGTAITATVSIGCATVRPREGSSSATLIAAADEALYRAKSEGRNRVRVANAVPV